MDTQTHVRLRESRLALKAVTKRRHQVRDAMIHLEIASSSPQGAEGWQDKLLHALDTMHRTLVDHVADGRDPNGALQQIAVKRPDLEPAIRRLQADQGRLIDDLFAITQRAGHVGPESLRADVVRALTALSRCRQSSADLFYECYCVDVGATTDS